MDAHNLPSMLLFHPAARLSIGIFRNFGMGILFGLILLGGYARTEALTLRCFAALMVVGVSVSFSLWGSFRVWSLTILPMLGKQKRIIAALTRIPFWGIAGGLGYTTVLLLLKRFDLFPAQDIPVRNLFITGCLIGAGIQLISECIFWIILKRIDKT